tara:strand:- start:12 stop:236 length:225 start_codon:yes stop_codon:yes gene_type:complete
MQPFEQAWNLLKLQRNPANPVQISGMPIPAGTFNAEKHPKRGALRSAEQREFERRELESLGELPLDYSAQEPPE